MAGRYLNKNNAQQLLNVHKEQIKAVQKQLAESSDPTDKYVLEAMQFGDDMSRISALDDFYRPVPSAKPEMRNATQMNRDLEAERENQRKLAIAGHVENKMNVNGVDYVIEDLLRNPSIINERSPRYPNPIPAEVLRRKEKLYPEGINLVKIPQAQKRSEATLLSLAMNELEGRYLADQAGTPVKPFMDLSYESRKMDDGLREALTRQYLLDKRSPLEALTKVGMRSYDERAAEPGAFEKIQSVMIGDMVRGFNPVNGVLYGAPYMENGVLVRDTLEGGHVKEHAQYGDLSNKAFNIIGEGQQENRVKSRRGAGDLFTDKQALLNNVSTALNEGNDLSALKHNLMFVAEERPELKSRVLQLLDRIETVQQMPAIGRGGRQAAGNSTNKWSIIPDLE